jgi:hypothetical protein
VLNVADVKVVTQVAPTPQQLAELLAKDTAKWEQLIRSKNIQPQ